MSERMEIGKIVNTIGLKGEVKVYPYIDDFTDIKFVYVNNTRMEIERIRNKKTVVAIKFKEVNSIDEAEELRNEIIELDDEDAPELEEGKYYIKDLIGFEVITDEGKVLGKLDDIFNTGANDIYQVGKILLPGIDEVIKEIDTENKKITVHIIKGLLD